MEAPKVVDLFCGAGGLSEGFRQAGFDVLAGNDIDEIAGETFLKTHAGAKFFSGPIDQLAASDLMRVTGLRRSELDVLAGGPPCQAFSVYNHKRGLHDARSSLFREYLRLVAALNPCWIVMENVTGILSCANGAVVDEIKSDLAVLGYSVDLQVLKAEEFGIPQERRRVFIIGNRIQAPIPWPKRTHGEGMKPYVTVRDAISDLPSLKNGESCKVKYYSQGPQSEYQKALREKASAPLNHSAPKLQPVNIERMKHIPAGGSWRNIPLHLLPEGMKRARRCDHTKRYGRLQLDGLASTILTKCDLHWGPYIHPEQDRVLSVREAARFQSFPDWFEFSGSKTEQYIQVGNAVPPLLGRCVGEALLTSINVPQQNKQGVCTTHNQLSMPF